MKNILLVLAIITLTFAFSSCQKKEEQAVKKPSMAKGPIIDTQPGSLAQGQDAIKKTVFQVIVPPEVKDQWSGVKIIIEDKKESKQMEITANVGGEFKIPDSNLTVQIGPFLPDFKMSSSTITSVTNDPKNPAVGVAVMEDGKKLFPPSGEWGWLYMNFPTVHSFQHERYGLVLKEGVKK